MLAFLILYLISVKKERMHKFTFIFIAGFQILMRNLYKCRNGQTYTIGNSQQTHISIEYFLYYITILLSFFIIVYFSNELRALDDCPRFFPRTYNKFLSTHIKHIQIFFTSPYNLSVLKGMFICDHFTYFNLFYRIRKF